MSTNLQTTANLVHVYEDTGIRGERVNKHGRPLKCDGLLFDGIPSCRTTVSTKSQ